MKKYEFLCGGDRGAWECLVDVDLTPEEERLLKQFAKNDRNEFLDWFPPMDTVYTKVIAALEMQCNDEFDTDSVVIRLPVGLRDDI